MALLRGTSMAFLTAEENSSAAQGGLLVPMSFPSCCSKIPCRPARKPAWVSSYRELISNDVVQDS